MPERWTPPVAVRPSRHSRRARFSVNVRRVLLTADDFGLTPSVNEAVERAHRAGVLHAASLMVAGSAAADAVRRARTMPNLRVGLHLVVIEGAAVLPPAEIPDLVDAQGWFPSRQFRLGLTTPSARASAANSPPRSAHSSPPSPPRD